MLRYDLEYWLVCVGDGMKISLVFVLTKTRIIWIALLIYQEHCRPVPPSF